MSKLHLQSATHFFYQRIAQDFLSLVSDSGLVMTFISVCLQNEALSSVYLTQMA